MENWCKGNQLTGLHGTKAAQRTKLNVVREKRVEAAGRRCEISTLQIWNSTQGTITTSAIWIRVSDYFVAIRTRVNR